MSPFIIFCLIHQNIFTEDILTSIINKAKEERIYSEREWHVLLHYKPRGEGVESLIDDPGFFISPDGKHNPEAELEATLKSFFEDKQDDDKSVRCHFIARYEWLKKRLNLDDEMFGNLECRDFNDKYNRVKPKSIVLVFPAAYMNNPSSMFGHTLLRIDSSDESKLLSHAVNYAANVENAGILYPIKGVFGLYKGYFKVFPYYDMVKDYNDTEQRDMWEYKLNFSEEEVRKIFLHLWELKDKYSYYYFFDENCSYNLLFLLEAGRPTLHLTEKIGYWTIPVDTIRAVIENGLVEEVSYRPAMATKIRHLTSFMGRDEKKIVSQIVNGKLKPDEIPEEYSGNRINILDASIEIIQYNYNKGLTERDEYLKGFLSVLRERSKYGHSTLPEIAPPERPENGHFSGRIGIGITNRRDKNYAQISYRPAYHSLIDPDQGFIEGSQIIFLETTFRGYPDGVIVLDKLNVIDIVSLSPRDKFFKPISWKVQTGFFRTDYHETEQLVYKLNAGFGIAYKNKITGLYYILGEAELNIGNRFRGNYTAGAGFQAGLLKNIMQFWKINLIAEALFYGFIERYQEYSISATQTLRLSQENSLNLSAGLKNSSGRENREFNVNWNYFF